MTFEDWYKDNHQSIDDRMWEALEDVGMNICAENIVEILREVWEAALHYRDNPTKCACGDPVVKLSKAFKGPSKWCSHCGPGP
jgi:hypothetical protein